MRFWITALFLLLATSARPANETLAVPTRLVARIGGFLGSSYSVELNGGTLTYTASDRGQTNIRHATITPTEAAWREFRRTLDELKVWQWQNEYPRGGVVDGTQWQFEIAYSDRSLKSRGDNNYPDADGKPTGKPEFTPAFNRYLGAIKKLLGGSVLPSLPGLGVLCSPIPALKRWAIFIEARFRAAACRGSVCKGQDEEVFHIYRRCSDAGDVPARNRGRANEER